MALEFLKGILNPDSEKSESKDKKEVKHVVENNNDAAQNIKVEVQTIKGVFSKEDFKEFAKMAFSSSAVGEVVLIGSSLMNDKNNALAQLILAEVNVKVCDEYSANYILVVEGDAVVSINVIISEQIDTSLKELLEQNNHIIRATK